MFSPDGRWLAYFSNESGQQEVYVRPFPGPGGLQQISNDGGAFPAWSRTRPELFYRDFTTQQMMVASYSVLPAIPSALTSRVCGRPLALVPAAAAAAVRVAP